MYYCDKSHPQRVISNLILIFYNAITCFSVGFVVWKWDLGSCQCVNCQVIKNITKIGRIFRLGRLENVVFFVYTSKFWVTEE